MPHLSGLVTATVLYIKIGKVANITPHISGLVITTVLNTKIREVRNEMPYTIRVTDTPKFKELTKINFDGRMKEVSKNLATVSTCFKR